MTDRVETSGDDDGHDDAELAALMAEPADSGVAGWQPKALRRTRRANVLGGRTARVRKIKMSPEEELLVTRLAGEAGMTVQRYLMDLVQQKLGNRPADDHRQAAGDLIEVRRLLLNVGNNVNQIAHAANIDGDISAADLGVALAEVRRVAARVDAAVDVLIGVEPG